MRLLRILAPVTCVLALVVAQPARFSAAAAAGTEATLASFVRARGFKTTKVLTFENLEKLFGALQSDRCNAMSTDKSALAAWRGNSPKPDDYTILP